jgi:membrane-associated phospholipid phosphatase
MGVDGAGAGPPAPGRQRAAWVAEARRLLGEAGRRLTAADQSVYTAVAAADVPWVDGPLRRLSQSANQSRLWFAVAAAMAVAGGPDGRRAAVRGVIAIGAASATVNLGVKSLRPRQRPDRVAARVPAARLVAMPSSGSFPSGHSASAFAFACCAGRLLPPVAVPLRVLAAAVAYSRVHTGVHFPGDVLIGSVIGAAIGRALARWP